MVPKLLESVTILRRGGIPLVHYEREAMLQGEFDSIELFHGFIGAIVDFSEKLENFLHAIVLERQTLWMRVTPHIIIIVAVKRKWSLSLDFLVGRLAWELADVLSDLWKESFGAGSEEPFAEEEGFYDLFKEIIHRESVSLEDQNVRKMMSRFPKLEEIIPQLRWENPEGCRKFMSDIKDW